MLKRKTFKSFDDFPFPICIIDNKGKIVYNNKLCNAFVEFIAPTNYIDNSGLLMLVKSGQNFIYDRFSIESKMYQGHQLLLIHDIEWLSDKLHDIRHDIKNQINPLAMLSSLGVDTAGMVKDVNTVVDTLQPSILFKN